MSVNSNNNAGINVRLVPSKDSAGGMKDDKGKVRWDLIDFESLDELAGVLTYGAQKYEEDNWQKVDHPQQRYFSAIMRHISAWKRGEVTDEDGYSHMAHVMANAMFLMYFDRKEDD